MNKEQELKEKIQTKVEKELYDFLLERNLRSPELVMQLFDFLNQAKKEAKQEFLKEFEKYPIGLLEWLKFKSKLEQTK